MEPDLEVVHITQNKSFAAWSHGYPFRTVRWHFHPEYEVHLVVATSGRYLVGDFIGDFRPGNLVLTGPNLPHNWISDVPAGQTVPVRGQIIQFTEDFISNLIPVVPETSEFRDMLAASRRGLLFGDETVAEVAPLMGELMSARGARRVELFLGIMGALNRSKYVESLASSSYVPDPSGYMSTGINKVLAYLREHLTEDFREAGLAQLAGLTPSAFSRSFRRHTGITPIQYISRLRINLACQLLSDTSMPVTRICYESGFKNLSNFNRQFLNLKGVQPTAFRKLMSENKRMEVAA